MKPLKQGAAALLVSLLVVAAGCGYHLAGGGYLNQDVARVSVDVFENKSSEIGAGISFTNELIREITAKTDTQVVNGASRRISGTVNAVTFSTLARSSSTNVTEREVKAVVDVKLMDGAGDILWSVKRFSAKDSYTVSSDSEEDEAAKREAVDTIAQRVAERLVSRMTHNF